LHFLLDDLDPDINRANDISEKKVDFDSSNKKLKKKSLVTSCNEAGDDWNLLGFKLILDLGRQSYREFAFQKIFFFGA
jgi:hypothetical protein